MTKTNNFQTFTILLILEHATKKCNNAKTRWGVNKNKNEVKYNK